MFRASACSLILLASVAGCAKKAPPPPATPAVLPAQQEVVLRFGWPAGTALRMVVEDRVERQRSGDRVEVRELSAVVPLRLEPEGEGFVVSYGEPEDVVVRLDGQPVGDQITATIAMFDASHPSVRITAGGRFEDLADPDAAVAALHDSLALAFSGMEVPPPIRQSMDDLEVETLRRRARNDWFALVEGWEGEWTARSGRRTTEVVPGDEVEPSMTYAVRRRFIGESPCSGESGEGCVSLSVEREPIDSSMKSWVDAKLERHSRRGPVTLVSSEFNELTTTTVRVDSLLPTLQRRERVTRVELAREDGTTFTPVSKREVRTVRFEIVQ